MALLNKYTEGTYIKRLHVTADRFNQSGILKAVWHEESRDASAARILGMLVKMY